MKKRARKIKRSISPEALAMARRDGYAHGKREALEAMLAGMAQYEHTLRAFKEDTVHVVARLLAGLVTWQQRVEHALREREYPPGTYRIDITKRVDQ